MTGRDCPHPSKKCFPDKDRAEASLSTIWRYPKPGILPSRSYLCRCGFYHLTHKSRTDPRPMAGEVLSNPNPMMNG